MLDQGGFLASHLSRHFLNLTLEPMSRRMVSQEYSFSLWRLKVLSLVNMQKVLTGYHIIMLKAMYQRKETLVNWNTKRNSGEMALSGVTDITGPVEEAKKDSLEEFLFERYSLYTIRRDKIMRGYTHHKKWQYQAAEVALRENSLTESFDFGIKNYLSPDLIHFSDGVNVETYSIEVSERIGDDINRDFLFLDGDCGLCHRLANFIDKRVSDKANLGYRPNTATDAQRVISCFPQKFIDADTVYLIRNGKVYMKSSAAIRCLLYMKWYYRMLYPIFWLVPLPARNLAYSLVARFRHKIFKETKSMFFPRRLMCQT